jgi:ABC-type hemin transport system ATPase subunit
VLREGRVLAAGPLDEALRADVLSAAFGLELDVERRPNGRFSAWAR